MSEISVHDAPDAPLAHHFDDLAQQRDSAQLGMWVFLVTEVMFFGALFVIYSVYRTLYHHAFAEASHHLNMWLGGANTAVLLSSSLSMALAVHSAELRDKKTTLRCLALTLLFGLTFLGVKAIEYTEKFHHHLVPGAHFHFPGVDGQHAELFFSLYFIMTGLHALHMIIGVSLLSGFVYFISKKNEFMGHGDNHMHIMGLYWHFVDIVWIFLFPLLYLIQQK